MKLIGLMPVRNEDWCLGLTLRAALMWCDEVVVLLHGCADGSMAIADGLWKEFGIKLPHGETGSEHRPGRVHLVTEANCRWDEMAHRQTMLMSARSHGATHIALIDADEILTGNLANREWWQRYMGTPIQDQRLMLPGYNLRGGIDRYHSNGIWGFRAFTMAFRDRPALNWSGHQHHRREPFGTVWQEYTPVKHGQGGVMHLWGASERRLRAKHALYKMRDRLAFPQMPIHTINQTYNLWRAPHDSVVMYPQMSQQWGSEWTFAKTPAEWWEPYADLNWMKYLHVDQEPWQEEECKTLLIEHGAEAFAGLDLFGVV